MCREVVRERPGVVALGVVRAEEQRTGHAEAQEGGVILCEKERPYP